MFHHISKTPKKELKFLESTRCSGAFLTNFEVFGNVIKHSLEYLISSKSKQTGRGNKIVKFMPFERVFKRDQLLMSLKSMERVLMVASHWC